MVTEEKGHRCDFCGGEFIYPDTISRRKDTRGGFIRIPGKPYLPFKCSHCGGLFCVDHRLPEKHNCAHIVELKLQKSRPWKHEILIPSREESIELENVEPTQAGVLEGVREELQVLGQSLGSKRGEENSLVVNTDTSFVRRGSDKQSGKEGIIQEVKRVVKPRTLRIIACVLGVISVFLTWIEIQLFSGGGYMYLSLVDFAGFEMKFRIFTGGFGVATVTLLIFGLGCIFVYFNEWGSLAMFGGVGYFYVAYVDFSSLWAMVSQYYNNGEYDMIFKYFFKYFTDLFRFLNSRVQIGFWLAVFATVIGVLGLLLKWILTRTK